MPQQRFSLRAPLSSGLQPGRTIAPVSLTAPHYRFNWRAFTLASLVAATAMTLYMLFVPRWLGIEQMDIGLTVGGMADPQGGLVAFLVRVAWHMGNAIVYLPIYVAVLLYLRKQSTAGAGAVFSMLLWLVGPMLLIPLLLNLHPAVQSGELTNPGVFMLALGLGWKPAAIDLGAHLCHGILAGVVYKHRGEW